MTCLLDDELESYHIMNVSVLTQIMCSMLTDQHKLQIAGTCLVVCTANQQFAFGDTVKLFS